MVVGIMIVIMLLLVSGGRVAESGYVLLETGGGVGRQK